MNFDSFEVGDIVTPLHKINFCDGTEQIPGVAYTILAEEISYYNVMGKNYRLIGSVQH